MFCFPDYRQKIPSQIPRIDCHHPCTESSIPERHFLGKFFCLDSKSQIIRIQISSLSDRILWLVFESSHYGTPGHLIEAKDVCCEHLRPTSRYPVSYSVIAAYYWSNRSVLINPGTPSSLASATWGVPSSKLCIQPVPKQFANNGHMKLLTNQR